MPSALPKTVAVIGAGISGVVSAAHLKREGLEVVVFERSAAAGGVWLYDERKPLEPTYPALLASKGENHYNSETKKDQREDPITQQLLHAPPGPCYIGLQNNIGTRLLQTTLNSFPEGTPDIVRHDVLLRYIQDTALVAGVHEATQYGTEVKSLHKKDNKWLLEAVTLGPDASGIYKRQSVTSEFDAVVVASGHYHAARVPDIPGLADWKRQWPDRVQHSKSFRDPKDYKGKNFLLIGAGVSSTDIARELEPQATHIYQSHRNGLFDLPTSMIPDIVTRVDEIASFELPNSTSSSTLEETEAIPLTVTLKSGRKLCDIHNVIVCTGYHVTLPFLPDLHSDNMAPDAVDDTVLVTDGAQIHNLHKDIFYIKDPTLLFVGVPYFTATFTLFEFQAMVVAKVVSGLAKLPSEHDMRVEYEERVKEKGYGKSFHSLRGKEIEYVDELLDWVNKDLELAGRERLKGHTDVWKEVRQEMMERFEALFAEPPATPKPLHVVCS